MKTNRKVKNYLVGIKLHESSTIQVQARNKKEAIENYKTILGTYIRPDDKFIVESKVIMK